MSKALAKSLHRMAQQKADKSNTNHQMGEIKRITPLVVDPFDLDYLLQEDDIILSQDVRLYNKQTGLKAGDNLVLHHTSGHWVAVDVLSNTNVSSSGSKSETFFLGA